LAAALRQARFFWQNIGTRFPGAAPGSKKCFHALVDSRFGA